MGLFKKLRDYNEELELVLDKKYFSSSIKNVLLSMIYKIERSYPDYTQVKRHVRAKEDFLMELIDTVKNYCEHIKTVEPESNEAEVLRKHKVLALTNERERSILAYPTEISMLYAISDIMPKYFAVERDFVFKRLLQTILVEGYNYNNVSMLQDFNGWTWDNAPKKNTPFISNLIYQNLLCLFGEDYLAEWRNSSNVKAKHIEDLKRRIQDLDSNNNYFYQTLNLIYKASKEQDRLAIESDLKKYYDEYCAMQNMDNYLRELSIKKHAMLKRIGQIDMIHSKSDLLAREYNRFNKSLPEDKRIGNANLYSNMLKNERFELEEEVARITKLQNPVEYINRRSECSAIAYIYSNQDTIDNAVIKSQLEYLKLYDKKIANDDDPEQIIDIIYELRYYRKINLNERHKVESIPKLKEQIDAIMKKALIKACKLGVIKIVSMDISINFDIIDVAFATNMIDLYDTRIELDFVEVDKMSVKVFDKDSFEYEKIIDFKGDRRDLQVKLEKPIKIFTNKKRL